MQISGSSSRQKSVAQQIRVLCVVSILGMGFFLMGLSVWAIFQDRKAHLYEVQYAHLMAARAELRVQLKNIKFHEQLTPQFVHLSQVAEHYGIPRLPETGEIFLGRVAGSQVFVTRGRSGEYLMAELRQLDLCSRNIGVCYLITSFGDLVMSTTSVYQQKNVSGLGAVQNFLSQGLSQGIHVEGNANTLLATFTSYSEVPDTNLVLFSEGSIVDLIRSLARILLFMLIALFGAGAFLWALLRVQLSGALRPFRFLVADVQKLGNGNYDIASPGGLFGEFATLYEGLRQTGRMLYQRENAVLQLQKNLEAVLTLAQRLSLVNSVEAAMEQAATVLAGAWLPQGKWCQLVYEVHPDLEVDASGSLIAVYTLRGHGALLESCECVLRPEESHQAAFRLAASKAVVPERVRSLEHVTCLASYQGLTRAVIEWTCEDVREISREEKYFFLVYLSSLASAIQSIESKVELQEKTRIDLQIQVAERIQERFSPQVPPRTGGIEWSASIQTAERVGGDCYAVNTLLDGRYTLFLVADATGHGVQAAMLTAVCQGVTSACNSFSSLLFADAQQQAGFDSDEEKYLSMMATLLNESVLRVCRGDILMSASMILVNNETGQGHYISAGHPPAILMCAEAKKESLLLQNSLLGVELECDWKVGRFVMEAGDLLFCYTDGALENHVPGGKPVRLKALLSVINTQLCATEILHSKSQDVLDAIKRTLPEPPEHTRQTADWDDTTLLVIHRCPEVTPP